MQLKQISEWVYKDDMEVLLSDEEIKSWLLEKGPITKRIKLNHNFELNLIRDEVDQISQDDKVFLDNIEGDIKVREVILLGNGNPLVYAKSYIPIFTINNGLKKLGQLGSKPLGDILFEKNLFQKKETLFTKFLYLKNEHWGRKSKYHVNGLPLSVMEVFLI